LAKTHIKIAFFTRTQLFFLKTLISGRKNPNQPFSQIRQDEPGRGTEKRRIAGCWRNGSPMTDAPLRQKHSLFQECFCFQLFNLVLEFRVISEAA